MDEIVNDENKLLWFKWYCSDVRTYLEADLTYDQIGMLFVAVMQFVENGIKEEVEPAIKLPYLEKVKDISIVREKYNKKCETNAKNGAKGGTKKGENARKAAEASPGYKLPSKTGFRELANSVYKNDILEEYDEEDVHYDKYIIDCLYEDIINKQPPFNRIQIKNNYMLEITVACKLCGIKYFTMEQYFDLFGDDLSDGAEGFLSVLSSYKMREDPHETFKDFCDREYELGGSDEGDTEQ